MIIFEGYKSLTQGKHRRNKVLLRQNAPAGKKLNCFLPHLIYSYIFSEYSLQMTPKNKRFSEYKVCNGTLSLRGYMHIYFMRYHEVHDGQHH